MIFDTHAHYDDEAFDIDRKELLGTMKDHGVGLIVNVGASFRGVEATCELMNQYDFIYGALGIHPDEVGELDEKRLEHLRELLGQEKAVAVGEIGLDYYWDKESHWKQKEWFARQMSLARELDLPIVVHSREAAKDTLDCIRSEHNGATGGVIHCYSGSVEMARDYLNMGYYIGIGGVVTFKNARVMKEVAEYVPLERIVVETDCPYLSPAPNRGKRNSSLYLPLIIEAIAEIKGLPPREVEEITFQNGKRLYGI